MSGHPRYDIGRKHWEHPSLRYQFIEGDTELLPGVELIDTRGHVPGHQSVLVRLPQTGPVLLTGDAIPEHALLDPDQREIASYDMDAAGVRASTRKLVELISRERVSLTVFSHDAEKWKTLRLSPAFYE